VCAFSKTKRIPSPRGLYARDLALPRRTGYRLLGKGYWTGSQRCEDATERLLTGSRRAPVCLLVAAVLSWELTGLEDGR
jgi:hypothetical protein